MSCESAPEFATNYFNESNAIPVEALNISSYDGYSF